MKIAALVLVGFLGFFTLRSWWNVVQTHRIAATSPPVDFSAFYLSGELLREDPKALYDFSRQDELQTALTGANESGKQVRFYYPPITALLFVPFTLLSFSVAYLAMTALNVCLLAGALWFLIRRLALDRNQAVWLVLFSLAHYGTWVALLMGQVSFVALWLMLGYLYSRHASISAGLLVFKPALAPVAVFLGSPRALYVVAGVGVLSMVLVGPEGIGDYLSVSSRLASANHYLSVDYAKMNGVRGLIYYLVQSDRWRNILYVTTLCALLAWSRRMDPPSIVVVTILAAPHVHDHDVAALLTIPAAFMLRAGVSTAKVAALLALDLLPLVITAASLPPLIPVLLLVYLLGKKEHTDGYPDKNLRALPTHPPGDVLGKIRSSGHAGVH